MCLSEAPVVLGGLQFCKFLIWSDADNQIVELLQNMVSLSICKYSILCMRVNTVRIGIIVYFTFQRNCFIFTYSASSLQYAFSKLELYAYLWK
jgi:hypothetical protein